MTWYCYVDTREPDTIMELLNLYDLDFEQNTLTSADFALYYSNEPIVGIERKTISDLVNSIINKRLFSQLDRMNKMYKVNVLAISGTMTEYEDMMLKRRRKVRTQTIMGTLASAMTRNGCNIMWFEHDDYLVDCLCRMFKKVMQGKYGKIRSTNAKGFEAKPESTLMIVPGIRLETAQRLIERFGTIKDIAMADKEELKEVKGIGDSRAQKIKELFNGG